MPERDRRREILELVATGRLTPEEAGVLLAEVDVIEGRDGSDAAGQGGPPDPRPRPPQHTPPPDHDADDIVRVRVKGNCRAVSIVGDPDVRTAVAEGDHTARVEGGTLTIESLLERSHGFAFIRSPGIRTRARVRIGADTVRPLTIRMNPALALESEVDAGSTTIRGVRGPIRAATSAGALRIEDVDAPIDVKVAAGSATVRGRLADGASRVECDAGKVSMRLSSDSSVTIRGRVNLGQFNAPDIVGAGTATLDVVANLGAVEISVDDGDDEGDNDGLRHDNGLRHDDEGGA